MKKILLSLFVGFVCLLGFGFCELDFIVGGVNSSYGSTNFSLPKPGTSTLTQDIYPYSSLCLKINSTSSYCTYNGVSYSGNNYTVCFLNNSNSSVSFSISCTNTTNSTSVIQYNHSPSFSQYVGGSCDDPYTSQECQSEYNLIPIEDVDINYCVGNGLCPNECGSGTDFSGDLQYSNLYINSILHPGTQNIFVDIPDYITWDYSFTGDNFNLYVGSGYDVDYINSIIDINSYRPSSSDFTNIFVGGLTLIFPYIVILLFIVFVWKLLKRIFKS